MQNSPRHSFDTYVSYAHGFLAAPRDALGGQTRLDTPADPGAIRGGRDVARSFIASTCACEFSENDRMSACRDHAGSEWHSRKTTQSNMPSGMHWKHGYRVMSVGELECELSMAQ